MNAIDESSYPPADTPHEESCDIRLATIDKQPIKFLVCVDRREESQVALRLACFKARRRGGDVDILHVMEPSDAQSLFGVSDKMREEKTDEARQMLQKLHVIAKEIMGREPKLILREGSIGETILKTAQEDPAIHMLVLGVVPLSSRGKLIAWLSTQLGDKLMMPMMLVPGNLTDQQIEEIS